MTLQTAAQQALTTLESGALLCELTAASMLRVALEAEQAQAVEPVYGWLTACDAEMICAHIGVANLSDSYASAKAKLRALIDWHIGVATDPAVNGGFSLQPAPPPATGERAELIAGIKHELAEFAHNKTLETLLLDAIEMLEVDVSLINEGNKAQQVLSLDLLERLSKTLINLGYSTPEGGMEHFGARIESQLYNLCRGVDSILAQQVAVPDGWVLVPIEPTPAMSAAGFCVNEAEHDPAGVYRAMLAAAQGVKP